MTSARTPTSVRTKIASPPVGRDLVGDLPAPGLIDIGYADRGAFTGQNPCGGPADSRGAARNDGRLAGDPALGAHGSSRSLPSEVKLRHRRGP